MTEKEWGAFVRLLKKEPAQRQSEAIAMLLESFTRNIEGLEMLEDTTKPLVGQPANWPIAKTEESSHRYPK